MTTTENTDGDIITSITNTKGVTFVSGSIVSVRGSKVQRVINTITDGATGKALGLLSGGKLHGSRIDGSEVAFNALLDPEKLTLVK